MPQSIELRAFFTLCLAAMACGGRQDPPILAGSVWTDPKLVRNDTAQYTSFDEGGGSLLTGEGWFPDESAGPEGPWHSFAWAGKEVELRYLPDGQEARDLVLHCHPAPVAGDQKQRVAVVADGTTVAEADLPPGWRVVRLPLPEPSPRGGFAQLLLRFEYAAKPSDIGSSADSRSLAAACSDVAIVPRWVRNPLAFIATAGFDAEHNRLSLPVGAVISVPLPVSRSGRLRVRDVAGCPSCTLSVSLLGPGGEVETLYEGAASFVAGRSLHFTTPVRGIARLRFERRRESGADTGDGGILRLALDSDSLEVEPAGNVQAANPNVFIYLVDTLRADSVEPYGAATGRSPAVREFAQHAVTYEQARAASTWTLPSVVSLLTGSYPFRHGVMKGKVKLSNQVPTLAGTLSEAGWSSVGFSQSFIASGSFGVDHGFDEYFVNNQLNSRPVRAARLRSMLLEWLYSRGDDPAPIFAYLHDVAPHAPYDPPPPFDRLAREVGGLLPPGVYSPRRFQTGGFGSDPKELAHLAALYEGEVGYSDQQFGRFVDMLRGLGLFDDSYVVLVADHGEEFNEHGGYDHGRTLYGELMRVPLLIHFPHDEHAGERVAQPVSLVDVMPTLLAGLGLEPGGPDGRDISPRSVQGRSSEAVPVFSEVNPEPSETLASVDLRALLRGDLKCIQNLAGTDRFGHPAPSMEVYDLAVDAGEQSPIPAGDGKFEQCSELLESWAVARARAMEEHGGRGTGETSESDLERLRALGYIH